MVSAKADVPAFPTRRQTDLTRTKINPSQVCLKYFSVTVKLALLTYLRISKDSILLQIVNRIKWKTNASPPLSVNFSPKNCFYKKTASLKRDVPTSQGRISLCLSILLLHMRHLKTQRSFLPGTWAELINTTYFLPYGYFEKQVCWKPSAIPLKKNLHLLPRGIKFFLVPNPILPCSDLGWS